MSKLGIVSCPPTTGLLLGLELLRRRSAEASPSLEMCEMAEDGYTLVQVPAAMRIWRGSHHIRAASKPGDETMEMFAVCNEADAICRQVGR